MLSVMNGGGGAESSFQEPAGSDSPLTLQAK
jgi:hypothetical protein